MFSCQQHIRSVFFDLRKPEFEVSGNCTTSNGINFIFVQLMWTSDFCEFLARFLNIILVELWLAVVGYLA
jgi:uncharacterized membrane protein YbhN (UPF0104 family)